jgi:hypothetical protein
LCKELLCVLFQKIVKLWHLFEWRWVSGLVPIKTFCKPHLCFAIVSTVSLLRYWGLVRLWYTSLVSHKVIIQSIPKLYTTVAFILMTKGQLQWPSWVMTLFAHGKQLNEFLEIRFGIYMVYFSGFHETIVRPIPKLYDIMVIS